MDIPEWLLTTLTPMSALIGILIYIGLAIVKGHLMPESTHQYIVNRHIKESEDLHKALDRSQAQVSELLEISKTFNAILASLRQKLEEEGTNKGNLTSIESRVEQSTLALDALEIQLEVDRSSP